MNRYNFYKASCFNSLIGGSGDLKDYGTGGGGAEGGSFKSTGLVKQDPKIEKYDTNPIYFKSLLELCQAIRDLESRYLLQLLQSKQIIITTNEEEFESVPRETRTGYKITLDDLKSVCENLFDKKIKSLNDIILVLLIGDLANDFEYFKDSVNYGQSGKIKNEKLHVTEFVPFSVYNLEPMISPTLSQEASPSSLEFQFPLPPTRPPSPLELLSFPLGPQIPPSPPAREPSRDRDPSDPMNPVISSDNDDEYFKNFKS